MCSVAGRLAAVTLNQKTMNTCTTIEEILAIPFFSQFSTEQIRRHVKKNAETLREMQANALKTGKNVNGANAEELAAAASVYEKMLA